MGIKKERNKENGSDGTKETGSRNRRYLPAGRQGTVAEGDFFRAVACTGDVCGKSCAGADRVRRCVSERNRRALKSGRDHGAFAVRDVYGGTGNMYAALSGMEESGASQEKGLNSLASYDKISFPVLST